MKDFEKEFYSHLGLLSVNFAKMESNLSVILAKLLGSDEELISEILIERNTLQQNIDLLKKINKIRGYEQSTISNLLEQISRIKSDRNLFIHGIWGFPFVENNDIMITCDERKIRYKEEKHSNGKNLRKIWNYNEIHTFRLSYIKKQIRKIEDILTAQNFFIEKLESETFL